MSATITISSKNQVVIPKEAREALELSPGTRLMVHVEDGMIIMVPEPRDYIGAMRGLHKEVWDGLDADAEISKSRDNWDV